MNSDQWESYLKIFEAPRKESIISSKGYQLALESMTEPIWRDSPVDKLTTAEKLAVRQAIKKLSEREQQVIYAIFWLDLSLSKVAAHLDMTKSSVQTLKKRAFIKLKRHLLKSPEMEPVYNELDFSSAG